ncbi:PUA-like domain-containing protein [Jackrogersella minutella]|nr:PUA-like domain-containing protein [Jackrogersella minutella]
MSTVHVSFIANNNNNNNNNNENDDSNNTSWQFDYMRFFHKNILYLGQRSLQLGQIPPEDSNEFSIIYRQCRMYLQWLDSVEMTPEIEQSTDMRYILQCVFNSNAHFPEDMKGKARELYEKGELKNWGDNAVADKEIQEPASSAEPTTDAQESANSAGPTTNAANEVPIVQSDVLSPIFREGGIMHGIMVTRSATGKKTQRMDPNVPKIQSKVFGHNNIAVGAWFGNQLVALHRGAHGMRMGGISGTTSAGAYSIIVAGGYEGLDDDKGAILYYSGSNSHGNTDPTMPAPSSFGTNALKASLRTGNPVRVLRSGPNPRSPWAPPCGIRYDGLYRVISLRESSNTKGGLYEQFILCRDPDQTPLETLRRISPTTQQKRDLAEVSRR